MAKGILQKEKGTTMRILLMLLLLSACQPVDFGNYNIIQGYEQC